MCSTPYFFLEMFKNNDFSKFHGIPRNPTDFPRTFHGIPRNSTEFHGIPRTFHGKKLGCKSMF